MTALQAAQAPADLPEHQTETLRMRSALTEIATIAAIFALIPAVMLALWLTRELPAHEGDE